MPRIICRYDVCVFNKKSRCTAEEIEYDPDQGCLTAQTREEFEGAVDDEEDWEEEEDRFMHEEDIEEKDAELELDDDEFEDDADDEEDLFEEGEELDEDEGDEDLRPTRRGF